MRSYRVWFKDPYGRAFSPEMYFRTPELAAETAKKMAYADTAEVREIGTVRPFGSTLTAIAGVEKWAA
jgi:hypothetical protein